LKRLYSSDRDARTLASLLLVPESATIGVRYEFCAALARRGPHSPNRKLKRAKTTKIAFLRIAKMQKQKNLRFRLRTLCFAICKMRVALDERLGCSRGPTGTMLHHWGYEHTRAICVPNEATTSTGFPSHVVRSEQRRTP
jgi:hypothetical protein